jgi:xanthine dehydrogenase accessory factor
MGSKTKRETIFSHLLDKKISQQVLGKVHSPIGSGINAQTPEEIAFIILAEIMKIHRTHYG